jgi:hypothetical protein
MILEVADSALSRCRVNLWESMKDEHAEFEKLKQSRDTVRSLQHRRETPQHAPHARRRPTTFTAPLPMSVSQRVVPTAFPSLPV